MANVAGLEHFDKEKLASRLRAVGLALGHLQNADAESDEMEANRRRRRAEMDAAKHAEWVRESAGNQKLDVDAYTRIILDEIAGEARLLLFSLENYGQTLEINGVATYHHYEVPNTWTNWARLIEESAIARVPKTDLWRCLTQLAESVEELGLDSQTAMNHAHDARLQCVDAFNQRDRKDPTSDLLRRGFRIAIAVHSGQFKLDEKAPPLGKQYADHQKIRSSVDKNGRPIAQQVVSELRQLAEALRRRLGGDCLPERTNRSRGTPFNRRKAAKGEAKLKIVAGLTEHHKYSGGIVSHDDPIDLGKFAAKYGVGKASVSRFLKKRFVPDGNGGGYQAYQVVCRDPKRLALEIKAMRGELSPAELRNEFKEELERNRTDD